MGWYVPIYPLSTYCDFNIGFEGAFKSSCLGLDVDSMKKYIKYVADYLLDGLGVLKFYNSVNPFQFMELISLEGKTNFFEQHVGDYSHAFVASGSSKTL